MILLISLTIAIIFGAGAFLILQRNLIRIVIGVILISNAANLYIIAAGLSRGEPPIYPLPEGAQVSDPLVQAMVLTAIVISSSIAAILLALVYRLYVSHDTLDLEEISRAERRAAERLDSGESLDDRESSEGRPEREERP
ncbi:MAG: NADH-quinone oxidoreductase subunit K [Rubrobacter sp.]|nr:NADH-quinone oxidoreductase subunit K [Rubrobacter sp.]